MSSARKERGHDRDLEKTKEFFNSVVSRGMTPRINELRRFARREGYNLSREELNSLYRQHNYVRFSERVKPKKFSSRPLPVFGCVFADLAYMPKRLARYNNGAKYIIVMVEYLSQKVAAYATRDKKSDTWNKVLRKGIKEQFPSVRP